MSKQAGKLVLWLQFIVRRAGSMCSGGSGAS